jgi:L-talarate/galactarate dehydratase
MKIARIVTRVFNTIDDTPLVPGLPEPEEHIGPRELVFVEVHTDEGVSGLGLTYWHGALAPALRAAVESFAMRVLGEDPIQTELVGLRLKRVTGRTSADGNGMFHLAKAAIDIACWDIKAKVAGLPLASLLGDNRGEVPAYASGALLRGYAPELLATTAGRLRELGFTQMKMQCGSEASDQAAEERVRVVREAVGSEVAVMCDVNQFWTVHRARRMGDRLEPYQLAWIEDPVSANDHEGSAFLARALRTPVVTGEYVYGVAPFIRLMAMRAMSIVMIDLLRVGGITSWVKVAAMADAYGLEVVSHRLPELDVHLVGGVPNGLTVEYRPLTSGLFEDTPEFCDGKLHVPDRPGHGLVLTPDAIARYQVYEVTT